MESFTPLPALVGGLLIGLASAVMLLVNGRIAGISGIVGALFTPTAGDIRWRLAFLGGLLSGGVALALANPGLLESTLDRPWPVTAAAGLLVGIGTRLGSGCTSGHGVCGISRLSPRSIVATLTFIAAGVVTVALYNLVGGGA